MLVIFEKDLYEYKEIVATEKGKETIELIIKNHKQEEFDELLCNEFGDYVFECDLDEFLTDKQDYILKELNIKK